MAGTVLVTGGTGFVAGWCIVALLEQGFTVRTTVRSPSREQSVRAAVARGGVSVDRLSFAVADLLSDDGWDQAMAGSTHVLHVASPLGHGGETDGDLLVRTAVEGTQRVLRAAHRASVERVVMTSSCAAITPTELGVDTVSDESTWSDPDAQRSDPYRRSKTLAERAAWDVAASSGLRLVTVLPAAVFGPVLDAGSQGSVQFIGRLVDGRMPAIPRVGLNIVDVRDVATIHVRAMTSSDAVGQRFVASAEFRWMGEVAATLRARLGRDGGRVPTRALPDWVVRLGGTFSPTLRVLRPLVGRGHHFSGDKARRALGVEYRSADDTVVDCARSLLAARSA